MLNFVFKYLNVCVIQFVWASENQVGPVDFKGPLALGPVGKNPNVAACKRIAGENFNMLNGIVHATKSILKIRPPLNKKLFPVHRLSGLKRAYWNFVFIFTSFLFFSLSLFFFFFFFTFSPCTF